MPPVPAAGVPLKTPAVERVTPLGRVPVLVNVGAGLPVAVTLKDPAVPTVKVVAAALVNAGAVPATTTKLSLSLALVVVFVQPLVLVALTVNGVVLAGVPDVVWMVKVAFGEELLTVVVLKLAVAPAGGVQLIDSVAVQVERLPV